MIHSQSVVFTACLLFIVQGALPHPAWASADWGIPNLKPEWSGKSSRVDPNQSFLADLDRLPHSGEGDALNGLIGKQQASELRQDYRDRFRDFELRARYGLLDPEQERKYQEEQRNFSRDVFVAVRSRQLTQKRKEIRRAAERIDVAREPFAVLAFLLGIYSGEPVDLKVNDDTGIRARSNMKDSQGELHLRSPLLNGSFEMSAKSPEERDPFAALPDDPIQRAERYKLSVSRDLPLDFSSGMTYGSTTRSVTASVSRPLSDHLTWELGTTRAIRNDRNEGTLKLLYDLRF
jgi:hypothetical protein